MFHMTPHDPIKHHLLKWKTQVFFFPKQRYSCIHATFLHVFLRETGFFFFTYLPKFSPNATSWTHQLRGTQIYCNIAEEKANLSSTQCSSIHKKTTVEFIHIDHHFIFSHFHTFFQKKNKRKKKKFKERETHWMSSLKSSLFFCANNFMVLCEEIFFCKWIKVSTTRIFHIATREFSEIFLNNNKRACEIFCFISNWLCVFDYSRFECITQNYETMP